MSGYTITGRQTRALQDAVADLRVRSESRAVLIIDSEGRVMACSPDRADMDPDTVSALAAGTFVAARRLAGMLGETTFRSISHEGEKMSLYMESAGSGFLVLVIFGGETIVGLVRLYTAKLIGEIAPALARVSGQTNPALAGASPFRIDTERPVFPVAEHGAMNDKRYVRSG